MTDILLYRLKVRGTLADDDLSAITSVESLAVNAENGSTTFSVSSDQSGLIGLLRQLHGRGLVLLSVNCEQEQEG